MVSFSTVGYKDWFSKFVYLITGIVVLFMVNWLVVIGFQNKISLTYIVILVILSYVFYGLYKLFKNLRYEFSNEGIKIIQNKNRTYFLEINQIEKIEKIDKLKGFEGFGIKYNYFNKNISFTTSITKLLKIYMKDGRVILISPKKFDDDFLKLIK